MSWVAGHLSWFVWALLVIWAPPLLYAIAIDLDLIGAPGSGFPTLRDPALILGALQVALMIAAVPGMAERRPRSWKMLAAACVVWCAHFAWGALSRLRLDGVRALCFSETWSPLGWLIGAAVVLLAVRRHFQHAPALQ